MQLDLCANFILIIQLVETWLTEGKDHSLCMLRDLLAGFRLTRIPHASRGGGLAILYRSSFIPKVNSGQVYSSFEYLDLTLSFGKVLCRFISFYRPPPSNKNKSTLNQFILDLSDLIERIITPQTKIVLAGDCNIHCDLPLDPHSIIFNDTLRTFDLQQHIISPTHCSGHTLDLVITKRVDNDLLLSTNVLSDAPSDHSYIICDLRFPSPRRSKLQVSRRNYNAIKMDSLVESLQLADFGSETNTLDELIYLYNSNILSVLDAHAPLLCRTLTSRPSCQWYTGNLREMKREIRRLEKKFMKSRSTSDLEILKEKSHQGFIQERAIRLKAYESGNVCV